MREPVAIGGGVALLAMLAGIFGLDLDETQLAGFLAVVVAIITAVQRSRVSPFPPEPKKATQPVEDR